MTLDDLYGMIVHTPRGQDVVVPTSDPELGPYTRPKRVQRASVPAGYRIVTEHEREMMVSAQDITATWTRS